MQRFIVLEKRPGIYYVFDTEFKQYNMPEMAVSIYFASNLHAQKVADIMNTEWSAFIRNPE